jgi:hypothetical protein
MRCLVCAAAAVVQQLDVGAHPVASFYLKSGDAPEKTHSLRLGQCATCGVIQLMQTVGHADLVPPYDWIFAREPEDHLDEVVSNLRSLPGVDTMSVIAGHNSKDDTTVDRFEKLGFKNRWRIRLDEDLGITNPNANIETVQKLTTPEIMAKVAARRGQADILICRHIIEHTEDIRSFVRGLAQLVKPGGYLMIEAPDCRRSLELGDFTMVWEEHSLYFTSATIENVLSLGGFETVRLDTYPYPFENSLVIIARRDGSPRQIQVSDSARSEVGLLQRYASMFGPKTVKLRETLVRVRREEGPVALFGAGHLACAFAAFHGLSDLIDFVVDDTPQKQGLFLPGARIPILPSDALVSRGVKLCLLAVSPNSEDRIIDRCATFVEAGGRFHSVLAASKRSFMG